jgi:hypothetical protein
MTLSTSGSYYQPEMRKNKKKSKLGMIIDLYRTKLLLWTISGSTGYEKFTS